MAYSTSDYRQRINIHILVTPELSHQSEHIYQLAHAINFTYDQSNTELSPTPSKSISFTLTQDKQSADLTFQILSFLSQIKVRLGKLPPIIILTHDVSNYFEYIPNLLALLDRNEILCDIGFYEQHQDSLDSSGMIKNSEHIRTIDPKTGFTHELYILLTQIDLISNPKQLMTDTCFIGRDSEYAQLLNRLNTLQTQEKLEKPLLLFSGEAGMGKSSFLKGIYPLIKSNRFVIAHALCLDFVSATLNTTLSQLTQSLVATTLPKNNIDTIAQLINKNALPYFDQNFIYADLLGMSLSAEEQRALSHYSGQKLTVLRCQAVRLLIEHITQHNFLCMIIEDLHWIDQEFRYFLTDLLHENGLKHRIIIVASSRIKNGLLSTTPDLALYVEVIKLQPLSLIESRELARQITHSRRLPWQITSDIFISSDWLEYCVVQSQGHPLYLTQLLSQAPHQTKIQDRNLDLTTLLMSRYHALSAQTQKLLAIASCFGRLFFIKYLPGKLNKHDYVLYEAMNANLILQQDEYYEFCHALVRDTIYQKIPESQKKQYHLQIAHACQSEPELYAEHLALAQDEHACEAFMKAAAHKQQAVQLQAALSLYERALTLDLSLQQKQEILCAQGWLFEQLGDGQRCLQCFDEAINLHHSSIYEQINPHILIGRLAAQRLLGQLQQAEQSIALIKERINRSKITLPLFKARFAYYQGCIAFSKGLLQECTLAHQTATQVIESLGILDTREAMNLYAQAWSGRGDAAYAQGRFISAKHAMQQAVDIAYEGRLGRVEVSTLHMLAIVNTYLGNPQKGIELAHRCHQNATRVNDLRAALFAELNVALPMLWAGDAKQSISYCRSALQKVQWMNSTVLTGMSNAFVAFSLWFAGVKDESKKLSHEALNLSKRGGNRLYGGVAIGAVLLNISTTPQKHASQIEHLLDEGFKLLKADVVSHNYFYFALGAAPVMLRQASIPHLKALNFELKRFFQVTDHQTIQLKTKQTTPNCMLCLITWIEILIDLLKQDSQDLTQYIETHLYQELKYWSYSGIKLFEQLTRASLDDLLTHVKSLDETGGH